VPQPRFALISVFVDEHAAAWQVSEHRAGVTGGHVQPEDSGIVDVFPVRREKDAQRENLRLHDLNLIS